ncbi:MAG: calcium/sodium antiporter [Gammaproteobacteria bacterium]|jgi:cation:H+ antiporter
MWFELSAIAAGFALLVWGADRFVMGAAGTARNLGVAPLIIGLTIVGFGTSAPEMLVSAMAAWQGNTGLAVGNAIGSNIANIALILGLTAVVVPLTVHSGAIRREFPVLIATTLIGYLLLSDAVLGFGDGLMLVFGLVVLLSWTVYMALTSRLPDPMAAEYEAEIPTDLSLGSSLLWLLVGLLVLLLSSRMLVWGAVGVAQYLGVSDLVIGLTIVALGTSLPELATSLAGAMKNEHDIVIGNVIGSNMFNLLGVLGIAAVIRPGPIEEVVLTRDFPVMGGLTVALLVMAYGFRTFGRISRLEGVLLLATYIVYQTLLYFTARA